VAELGTDANEEAISAGGRNGVAVVEQRRRTVALGTQRAIAEGRLPGNPDLAPARATSIRVRKENALNS
jgi:hypothetical protein